MPSKKRVKAETASRTSHTAIAPSKIRISADDIPYEATLDVAALVVKDLARLDTLAKKVAASELTETYNDGWNEYDEAQEDGTF